MKEPKILYILIGIFCVFAIIAGIYAQIVEGGSNTPTNIQEEIRNNTQKPRNNKRRTK